MANTLLTAWLEGLPLHDAWWMLGSEPHKEQYRDAGHNQALTAYLDKYLRDDLIYRIYQGEIIALGIQISPTAGDAPQIIPQVLFAGQPDVNWGQSSINALGREYAHVRIVSREIAHEIEEKAIDFEKTKINRVRGRPSTKMGTLVKLSREMNQQGKFTNLIRKQQVAVVQTEAAERFPRLFFKPPSRNTVLEALKRAGI